jgi:hypothetical protein
MQGSMVWQFGSNSFSLPLVEHSQGQYPWIVKQGEPVESGVAFLASAGGTPVPPDGQNLLSALDKNGVPEPSTPYSVYVGERVLQTATVVGGADLQSGLLLGALKLDFTKSYLLKLSSQKPVNVTATPLDGGTPAALGKITGTQGSYSGMGGYIILKLEF